MPRDGTAQAGLGRWLVMLGGLGAAALLIRGLYLASLRGAIFFTHLQTEPARYDAWATAIARGLAPLRPPLDEAPAYPYLVAASHRWLGRGTLEVAILQILIDALACALLADFTRRALGARAGIVAGALYALFAPAIYFTGQLEPATLSVFAVVLALWATPQEASRGRRWTLAGLAWAAAVLVRAELALAWPILLVHAALNSGRRAVLAAATAPALLLVASLSVNIASSGRAVLLTTGGGENLWIGNGAHADGVNPFVDGARLADARDVELRARDAIEADGLFRRKALDAIRAEPAHAARLLLRKLLWLWTDRELPNSADIEWQTAQSWLFHRPYFPLGFGVLLPLALAGAVLVGRERRLMILGAPVLVGVAVAVVFFTNARFRLVLAPALCVLAAGAIDRALRPLSRAAWAGGAAALVLGLLLAWNDFDGVRGYRIPELDMNTAALELTAGQLQAGLSRLARAVHARPSDPLGWLQLAGSLERLGRTEEARAAWTEARAALPGEPRLEAAALAFERRHPPGERR